MRAAAAAGLAIASLLVASSAGAVTREAVARRWAPLIYQETNDPIKDLLSAYDFDGEWDGDDNSENMQCWFDPAKCPSGDDPSGKCAGHKCPLVATVYFTVIETKTHWFVQYMPYHPLDWKLTNGHEHDTESVFAVVDKSAGGTGKLVAMETQWHGTWYQYADPAVKDGADNVDGPLHLDPTTGHPQVYMQMVGHGLCGGFAPPNRLFPDLSLTCLHGDTPHIDQTGIVYSPNLPATMPTVVDGKAVDAGYALVELRDSVWPHIKEIGAGAAFKAAIDFKGERCAPAGPLACPTAFGGAWEGNEGSSPAEPWAQSGGNGVSADGDQFFDPAYTISKRLTFAGEFSLDYCFNPYVGLDTGCTGTTASDAGPDAVVSDAIVPDSALADTPDASPTDGSRDANRDFASPATPGGCGCVLAPANSPPLSPFALLTLLALRRRSPRGAARAPARTSPPGPTDN